MGCSISEKYLIKRQGSQTSLGMKFFFLFGFFLAKVGFSHCSLNFLNALNLFGGGAPAPTTAPPTRRPEPHMPWITHAPTYPPTRAPTHPPLKVKCDVIWEEKVKPLCKTEHEKICKTDTKDHCHKIWEEKCWDEPIEHCHPKEECNHVLENVCKTEYTVTCDSEHGGDDEYEAAEDEYEAAGGLDRHRRTIQDMFPALGAASRRRRSFGVFGGGDEPTTPQPQPEPEPEPRKDVPPREELCHHHPETTCWDEPVEKCETIQECTKEIKNLCKKVPKEVCEPVSVEKCWDEPSEKCEYMMVKVARKHCRDPQPEPEH